MLKDRNRQKEILVYICIIIVQVIVLLYWAHVKTNFFIDDLYSLGYASNFTGEGDTSQYITRSPEFAFNKWILNEDFKHYLVVSEDERLSSTSFLNGIQKMLTGCTYFGLLNIAESIAGYSYVSARPAVLLNIILFILSEITLLALMRRFRMDKKIRYLALIMFGCSTYVISAVEYVRFYILVIFFIMLMLIFLHDFWSAIKWRKVIINALFLGVTAYFSYKNSELTIPYFGGLILMIIIVSVIAKKWKQMIAGIGVLIAGAVYVMMTTDFVRILLYPENYDMQAAGVALGASNNIDNATIDTVKDFLPWVRELFVTHYFGNYRLIFLFGGFMTMFLILSTERKKGDWFHIDLKKISVNNIRPSVFYSFFLWLAVYFIARHYNHGIYITRLFVFLIILIGIYDFSGIDLDFRGLKDKLKAFRRISLNYDFGYIVLLIGAAIIYTIFTACAGYKGVWRYYVFGFTTLTVIIWYMIDRIYKLGFFNRQKKGMLRILTVFVILSALMPFKERKIEYMYEDEKGFVSAVKENKDKDVVMFIEVDDGDPSRHETYDCVNLMSAKSKIYIVDVAEYEYDKVNYPDEFVLWAHATSDINVEIEDLTAHGFEVQELGTDHCSRVCLCRKAS